MTASHISMLLEELMEMTKLGKEEVRLAMEGSSLCPDRWWRWWVE